jgi:ABC-2 type transport system ATP-binding protein
MQIALMINMSMGANLLLLDEITSVIDVHGRKFFLDELKKYVEKGNTVIISTNIINELEFYTDQLVIIKDEKIQLNIDVKNIEHDFIKVRKVEGTTDPLFESTDLIWSGVNSDRSVSFIIPKHQIKGEVEDSSKDRRGVTLEDIFVYYFSDEEVQL